jgi:putative glycosyltransferase (TIGR04372 family)
MTAAEPRLLSAARSQHKAGRWAAAEALYRRVIADEPQFKAVALHALGSIALASGKARVAADRISKAIKEDPGVPLYYLDLARALEKSGFFPEAVTAAEGALHLGGESPELLTLLSELYLAVGRTDDALSLESRFTEDPVLREQFDADPVHRAARGRLRRKLGEHQGARRDLIASLLEAPSLAPAWYDLGRLERAAGNQAKAVRCYEHALAISGEDLDVVLDMGISLQQLRRTERAISCFQRATLLRPHAIARGGDVGIAALDDVDVSPDRAEAVRARGLEAERLGRHVEAVTLLALSWSLAPRDSGTRQDLGRVLADLGKRRAQFHFLPHSAFGNVAIEAEHILRRSQLGQIPDDLLIVFVSGERPANSTQLTMLGRHVPLVIDDRLYYAMLEVLPPALRISDGLLWEMGYENFANPKSHRTLTFTDEEEQRGREGLRRLGVDPDTDWLVGVFAREDGWSKTLFPGLTDTFTPFRNADIGTYHPALRYILDRGGTVIRIGAGMKKPVGMAHPKVIDYALTARDDFMDMYLLGHCRLLIGTPAGVLDNALLFDTPRLLVNNVPPGFCTWGRSLLHVPKMLVRGATGEPVPIGEYLSILNRPDAMTVIYTDKGLRQHGLAYADNTPEEILEATEEMFAHLEGRYQESEEDRALYDRYFALFRKTAVDHIADSIRVRQPVALCHLRRHASWYFQET